ncbi:hypothetical protein CHLNCDRAFT_143903 [Chlorella variabilis]|uniref:Essential protein Yae1 N-terminal domain-containing protein n=1 Tax=Chlorella variabilis TaxID=554065 RepID=E1ZAP8_CHLVA|nr:hypothetical protein CHLNCDRAFT_143903 [Chlorella variabilis]EFN57097.1 hypothetical protein CHLNCDRAFT_143903 [Chlorella variabilis]|eukprot:XP_005849199.1 hypothetical protein CHLNCDRAFT_143903 [Chlorella variabilis]
MADLFDSALNLEEQHIREGYEEGARDGRRSGFAEGKALGVEKGFDVGHEVGYYAGCCQLWRQLQARDPQLFSRRIDKGMAALEEMVAGFPLSSPQDERLQELMDGMRGKFKALEAYSPAEQQGDGGGASATSLQF